MINRRRLLIAAAAVSATATAAYVAKPYLRKQLRPELDTAYPLGDLKDAEMRDIVALGETLAAPGFLPPADFIAGYVTAVTQSRPGYLKEYRSAVALLAQAGARHYGSRAFADLTAEQRDQTLQKVLWRYSGDDHLTPKIEKILTSRNSLALRIYVVSPLIEHYYRSPYAWRAMGYESFPGTPPLDPRAYTKPIGDYGNR
jgi:hypothetical protein